ncbi:aldo/keto reductase [Streptomyces sp. ZAF1911]|uniref:aldo/keto reductase n=1 Tax=Streptomyces sp. ZAF1911 TaxID=2944129 RepID=UPI00237B98DF|nr:aldo/keto reductase [Streptomyces sp. ZAF1911]MDD9382980.1 aldo/keto reductase [Streptomyces sp. ZAF1911]
MNDQRIPTVALGEGGPEVSAQGLGCMGMSFAYGPADADASRATLERALELGVTFFDTADMYGYGANEELLAPFVRSHRERVVLATKFGIETSAADPGVLRVRNDRAYLRQCVEASLRRLGVDHIDLYYMHRRDLTAPIEETVSFMAELVREGKVGHLGLSEVTGRELRAAHAVHPISAVQSEWSLFSRDVEGDVVPVAAELGVGFVPYAPLGRGFLTGAFTDAGTELSPGDMRARLPRYSGDNAVANAALLAPLRAIAERTGATPGQIALAWVHGQARRHGLAVVPIPGTRRPDRVEENLGAVRIGLTEQDLAALEPIAGQVAGVRFPDMSFVSAGRR